MGLFNTLHVCQSCHSCGQIVDYVQFKYGFTRLLDYKLGDKVVWDNDWRPWRTQNVGQPNKRKVAVDGIAQCPTCDHYNDYVLFLENDVITSIVPWTEDYSFVQETYIVLEE